MLLEKVVKKMDLWPNIDKLNKIETPKKILKKQGEYLSKKTNDIVYAICDEIPRERLTEQEKGYDFRYEYLITSKNLKNYTFKLFSIYHNITLYPLLIVLDVQVGSDIGLKKKSIGSKEEFEATLKLIFASKVMESVIGTLMNI